jgi:hypothetical protein
MSNLANLSKMVASMGSPAGVFSDVVEFAPGKPWWPLVWDGGAWLLRSEFDTKARCFPVSSTRPDWEALRMSMGLLSKEAGSTPRLSARSFRRGGVLLYASVAAHPAPTATAAPLHGLAWMVRYVARNMLGRSTSAVHPWTERENWKTKEENRPAHRQCE